MKIFKPPSNFAYSQAPRGGAQKCPFQRLQHSCCHGNNGCFFEAWGLIFIQKRRKKRVKFSFLYLRLNTILQIRIHFDKFNFPLTSYSLYSQIFSVYERSIEVFLFFFVFVFVLVVFTSESGNLLIYRKMSIFRLLWGDRWKLHGEIQRHAIVITYMFMTNDRCEDSFVQISRLRHVLNDIQV